MRALVCEAYGPIESLKIADIAVPEPKEGELSSYSLTMAARVAKGKVFIGNAGAEFPPFRGYVAAFDVNTGKELPWIVNAARDGWCRNGVSITALRKNKFESGPGSV